MSRATQADIARAAGVDKATVSRALAGAPCVLPATAARVRAAAEKLGYRADPILSAIAASRWRGSEERPTLTFGFISQFRQPHAGLLDLWIEGTKTRASQLGCRINRFDLEDFPNPAALQRVLIARGLVGLIVAPFYEVSPALELDWSRFCGVSIGITPYQPPLHAVAHDAFDGLLMAWRQVLSHGYRRPGLAIAIHGSAMQVEDDTNRRAAALLLYNDTPRDQRVEPLFYSLKDDYRNKVGQLASWYRQWKPDAVIGLNGGVMDDLQREIGIRVPSQMGFAQLTLSPHDNAAGIKEPAVEIGASAVDLLQLTLRTNQWGLPTTRIRHYVEPQWIDGPTLPPRLSS